MIRFKVTVCVPEGTYTEKDLLTLSDRLSDAVQAIFPEAEHIVTGGFEPDTD